MPSSPPPARSTRARTLGRVGERMAVRCLEQQGLAVLHRNWRCALDGVRGELDLVARDGALLVVCEVKARYGDGAGGALAAVTARKVARLRRLGAAYLAQERPAGVRDVRFDVVGVTWRSGGRPVVEHLSGIC